MGLRVWGLGFCRGVICAPEMENHMEKTIEHEMETAIYIYMYVYIYIHGLYEDYTSHSLNSTPLKGGYMEDHIGK